MLTSPKVMNKSNYLTQPSLTARSGQKVNSKVKGKKVIKDSYGNIKEEVTEYNISDYRTTCRSCKNIEELTCETMHSPKQKKLYKAGSLLNAPNSNFQKSKKQNFQQTRPSIDLEKAKKKLEDTKGKIPQMPRY